MAIESRPIVYISYSWISAVGSDGRPGRKADPRGLALADALRAEGVDVRLDLYAHKGLYGQQPPLRTDKDALDPWLLWAMQQIRQADVVLMLCSADYVRPDNGEPGGDFMRWTQLPSGAKMESSRRSLWWDWLAILAECDRKPQKFIPVGSGPYHSDLVPGFVRGANYYDLDQPDGPESLLRRIRQVWHERTPRSGVFVSYAHDDGDKWLDMFIAKLRPIAAQHGAEIWTDREIMPGDEWHLSIQKALDRAKVGVMLVSPAFLNSAYIGSDEFPKMLRAAVSEGMTIFWVPVVRVDTKDHPIARFHAAHPPNKPLAELSKAELGKALTAIVGRLELLL